MRICYSGLKFFFTRVLRREWGCKPEPPKILPENTVGAVSGLLYNPTLFSAHILPGFDRYYQPMVTLTENKCLASTRTSADFARMPEISGVPAYNPYSVYLLHLQSLNGNLYLNAQKQG